jgi:hypothetical protein
MPSFYSNASPNFLKISIGTVWAWVRADRQTRLPAKHRSVFLLAVEVLLLAAVLSGKLGC